MDNATQAADALRQHVRAAAIAAPEKLPALAKDVAVVVKLLRNPAEKPEESKFRKIKLANAAIARVLANAGVREVLQACGFMPDAGSEHLELGTSATASLLLHGAERVEAVQHMLQEHAWLHGEASSLALSWDVEHVAEKVLQHLIRSLRQAPTPDSSKGPWLGRLHHILSAPEMHGCRSLVRRNVSFAVDTVRMVALELIREGGRELQTLVLANKCLASLWPPGDAATLEGRLEFCSACLGAALPEDDELMELKLRLDKEHLLSSTSSALGAFSEMGVRCGVLKQELTIQFLGEEGLDAGGLRRQFFDRFTNELKASTLWTLTPAGSLRPADAAAGGGFSAGKAIPANADDSVERRRHFETCGRVCGMALYQELHRHRFGGEAAMMEALHGSQAANHLGDAFSRYFIRIVQHDPPATLSQLQEELAAETLDTHPDYRAGGAILTRTMAESGLDGAVFVRSVGEREVPLVEGGAELLVTEANKQEWLERLLRSELVESCAEAAADFRKGFVDVVGLPATYAFSDDPTISRWTTPHFFMLTAEELKLQWSGAPVSHAAIDELRSVAVVHPEVAVQAGWLWTIMLSLDDAKRAKYCRFMTGSSRRPSEGFPNFKIGPKVGGDGAFPFAHACVNSLDMPSYSSLAVLRERLEVAVQLAHDKFTDL